MEKQRWTAQQVKALRGIKRGDKAAMVDIAKRMSRSYASIYSMVWKLTGGGKRSAPSKAKMGKVRVTARYVIVRKPVHVSMKDSVIRIKL